MTAPRVIFAGGGTGGHLYPSLAMAAELRARGDAEVCFVGARGGMEEQILAGSGEALVLLPGRGLRGATLATRVLAPALMIRAIVGGVAVIRQLRPDVVVGTGGYASAAMVIAAIVTRTPRVLQEQNSVPGLVNRRLARFADAMLLAYEESKHWLPKGVDAHVVGNPLRAMKTVSRADARSFFELDPVRSTVLVIGGSRGAHSLNVAGSALVDMPGRGDLQYILLTGSKDVEAVRRQTSAAADRVRVLAYLEDVQLAYAAADVAVARAGASTVFELARFGLPTVFVPYPHAADRHQDTNAAALVTRGAALVVPDDDLDRSLPEAVCRLIDDAGLRSRMGAALQAWCRADAGARAVDEIMRVAKKKETGRLMATDGQTVKC